jgi:hypothetical protein
MDILFIGIYVFYKLNTSIYSLFYFNQNFQIFQDNLIVLACLFFVQNSVHQFNTVQKQIGKFNNTQQRFFWGETRSIHGGVNTGPFA